MADSPAESKIAVIAGASGFIGGELSRALQSDGYQIRTIGRANADAVWGDTAALGKVIDGSQILINLAGRIVNCRYNDANRNEIFSSRIDTTRELRESVQSCVNPPALWLNSSTATIYRYALDRPQTEAAGELGSGFSVDVAKNWENEFFAEDLPKTRRVALRMAIVLGEGPAKKLLFTAARLGLGGPNFDGWSLPHQRYRGIGPTPSGNGHKPGERTRGEQRFSWIHIDDVIGAVRFIRDNPEISGPVNLSAPGVTNNRELMALVRNRVRMPIGLPSYRWMLEIGMWLLRTESELVLKSRWVVPERLLESGYVFQHTDIAGALAAVEK